MSEQNLPEWSPQQEQALKAVDEWWRLPIETRPQVFRIFGFAGTGKTTLARHFAKHIDGLVHYCAYTGKAAHVMRSKGCTPCTTIHSLCYIPEEDKETGEVTFHLKETLYPSHDPYSEQPTIIVLDEVSMVGPELGEDLLSFGIPILVLGDPGQLPPIQGEGFFTDAKPDIMLTEIHRQAKDNPIIYLSEIARTGGRIPFNTYGESLVIPRGRVDPQAPVLHDQMLCGFHRTRTRVNSGFRMASSFDGMYPVSGERLICLRNDKETGLLNGMQFTARSDASLPYFENRIRKDERPLEAEVIDLALMSFDDQDDNTNYNIKAHTIPFRGNKIEDWRIRHMAMEFDFAYCITVHKAQGSQWDSLLLYDEWKWKDREKWLYTAITRAAQRITIVT